MEKKRRRFIQDMKRLFFGTTCRKKYFNTVRTLHHDLLTLLDNYCQ